VLTVAKHKDHDSSRGRTLGRTDVAGPAPDRTSAHDTAAPDLVSKETIGQKIAAYCGSLIRKLLTVVIPTNPRRMHAAFHLGLP
jgi:hypothetical protein